MENITNITKTLLILLMENITKHSSLEVGKIDTDRDFSTMEKTSTIRLKKPSPSRWLLAKYSPEPLVLT